MAPFVFAVDMSVAQLNMDFFSVFKTTRKPQHQQMQPQYLGGSLPNVNISLAHAQRRLDLQVIYCFTLYDCVFLVWDYIYVHFVAFVLKVRF